jgi:beta-glucosidase
LFVGRALRNKHIALNDSNDWSDYVTCWSPVVNIAKDTRWGRTPESYGECPFLTTSLADTYTKGIMGYYDTPTDYLKTAVVVKHFAVSTIVQLTIEIMLNYFVHLSNIN